MKGGRQKSHKRHPPQARECYNYYVDEDNGEIYYSFETPEADYTVYFNPNEYRTRITGYPYLLKNAYGFGFFQFVKHGVDVPSVDVKIKHTIESILCDFYDDNPNAVLLYHCYYSDGKQEKRSKKFERWYRGSLAKERIRKYEIDLEILTDGEYVTHYLGYLCSLENKDLESVHKDFENFVLSFPDEKAPHN